MSNFKVGDKVKFVSREDIPDMTYGKVYTVEGTYVDMIKVIDDAEESHRVFSKRFELVEESQPFEFRVGDIVEFAGCRGKVAKISKSFERSLFVELDMHDTIAVERFHLDGRQSRWHKEPLLKLIERPKKKEKRIVKTVVFYDSSLDKTFNVENSNFPHRIRVELEKEIEVEV